MQKLDRALMRERLTPWLQARMPHAQALRIASISTPSGGGNSAETAFFDIEYSQHRQHQTQALVLRRQLEGNELFMDADIELPWRMMQGMRATGAIPVPQLVGLELDRAILGNSFLVMAKVAGRMVPASPNYNMEGWRKEASADAQATVWRNAIDVMARIHGLDQHGFEFLNRPVLGATPMTQLLAFVERWYRWAARGREQPIADAALSYLIDNAPTDLPTQILWGDATPNNLLFADDLSVAAVLDWEVAGLGPGEADLAWWLMFDDLFSTTIGVPKLAGLPDRDGTIRMYEATAGRRVQHLDYFDVLAYLRLNIAFTRMCDREIAQGALAADCRAYLDNPITLMMARKFGLPEPAIGPDYFAAVAATSQHRQAS